MVKLFRRVQTLHEMMTLLHTALPHLRDAARAHDFASLLADIDAQCARLLDGEDINSDALQQRVSTALGGLKGQSVVLKSLRAG